MLRATTLLLRRTTLTNSQNWHVRDMSRGGFFKQVVENLKNEIDKNKEMKENLKKFKEEAAKLEQTEALQQARKKFKNIEEESASKLSENLNKFKETIGETLEKSKIGEGVSKTAETAKRTISGIAEKGDDLVKSEAFKVVSESIGGSGMYKAPEVLLKRSDLSSKHKNMVFEANTEAQGVELHADSKWSQGWENFKNKNPYVNKFMDMRTQLEESENPVLRASRAVTSKISDIFGNLFESTELSKVYTEILKADPNFDREKFLDMCEKQIIPTVLEAMTRPDLEILKDWTYEACYNVISTPLQQALKSGYMFCSRIMDVEDVQIVMGKIMDQGPVLIITFASQQVFCIKDKTGKVVEGDPDKLHSMVYAMCLCRDPDELNPIAAWRVIDISMVQAYKQRF